MQMPGHINVQFVSGAKAVAEAAKKCNLSQSNAITPRAATHTATSKNTPLMIENGQAVLPSQTKSSRIFEDVDVKFFIVFC